MLIYQTYLVEIQLQSDARYQILEVRTIDINVLSVEPQNRLNRTMTNVIKIQVSNQNYYIKLYLKKNTFTTFYANKIFP